MFNRIIPINSPELQPYKSRTPDFDTILDLKAGDLLDVCDTASIWINSTILKVTEITNEYHEIVREFTVGTWMSIFKDIVFMTLKDHKKMIWPVKNSTVGQSNTMRHSTLLVPNLHCKIKIYWLDLTPLQRSCINQLVSKLKKPS